MSLKIINYKGVLLEVEGRLIEEDEDGSPAYAEIDSVCVEGVDIGEMLTGCQWDDIERLVLEREEP